MSDFHRLITLADSEEVSNATQLPKLKLHKWLVLGQTDWVCRYGSLSDGHEKITDAQRYAQATKELYYLSLNIKGQKAVAKKAQARILRAKKALETVQDDADVLEAEANMEEAEALLAGALATVEDQMRMVKTYYGVIAELGPRVEEQYPMGIEQAELDNWKAVAEYKQLAGNTIGKQSMSNVPLPPEEKAKLGIQYGRYDMVAPLMVRDKEKIEALTKDGDVKAYLEHLEKEQKLLEKK